MKPVELPASKSSLDPKCIHPELCSRVLRSAGRGLPRQEFLREVTAMLVTYSRCDAVEIRIVERNRLWRCECAHDAVRPIIEEVVSGKLGTSGLLIPRLQDHSPLETVCERVFLHHVDPDEPHFTSRGSFWTGDAGRLLMGNRADQDGSLQSLGIVRFSIEDNDYGLLLVKSKQRDFFSPYEIESYEHLAQILGIAFSQRRAKLTASNRVSELRCLYGIAKSAAKPGRSLGEFFEEIVEIIPQGWLHPEAASARIEYAGTVYAGRHFKESLYMQTASIVEDAVPQGQVTVAYSKKLPELDEGPFLTQERHLIETIASEIAVVIEAKKTESERQTLQEQLRHADRLATIGQLAAGVAHELNEPLVNILGRAQLVEKVPGIPDQVRHDMSKIVSASLHAREIIHKLQLFARHAPPRKMWIHLNEVIHDALFLLESRCAKEGIVLIKELAANIPRVFADPGQLYQVLINLVVNAIQATKAGDTIVVRTEATREDVVLIVDDTGAGMDEHTVKHIFTPFFTTKEVDQGTGLGLSVVEGIIRSHNGSISVNSQPGQGSKFEVRLPVIGPTEPGGETGYEED